VAKAESWRVRGSHVELLDQQGAPLLDFDTATRSLTFGSGALPTSDPAKPGQVWLDSGALKVSAG